jgi:mono/diheme cytochrome c family protein
MFDSKRPCYLLLTVALAIGTAAAQTKTVIKDVPAKMTRSLDGKDLFGQFCAVCHGVDAKGNGPAAPALKKSPGDLTQLSRKHNGTFPKLSVKMSITGGGNVMEHGTREMPMWGSVLSETGQQKPMGDLRVQALLAYVEQIQTK